MRKPTLLLTGFEPFAGDTVNPSWELAQALHGERVGDARVCALRLPCVFGAADAVLAEGLRRLRPRTVVALGLAANRDELSVERVAINVDDARIADNAGAQPLDVPVIAGAPAAYFSRLPIKSIAAAWQDAGLPGVVSQTAGTFVCNHVFFVLMHLLRRRAGVAGGFIHVPALPGQAGGRPGLALGLQLQGIRLALRCAQAGSADIARAGGTIA